jgi:hypothetical protein
MHLAQKPFVGQLLVALILVLGVSLLLLIFRSAVLP